jgi:hypothetical protein
MATDMQIQNHMSTYRYDRESTPSTPSLLREPGHPKQLNLTAVRVQFYSRRGNNPSSLSSKPSSHTARAALPYSASLRALGKERKNVDFVVSASRNFSIQRLQYVVAMTSTGLTHQCPCLRARPHTPVPCRAKTTWSARSPPVGCWKKTETPYTVIRLRAVVHIWETRVTPTFSD